MTTIRLFGFAFRRAPQRRPWMPASLLIVRLEAVRPNWNGQKCLTNLVTTASFQNGGQEPFQNLWYSR